MPAPAIRAMTRLEDGDDVNMTLGAGVDGYSVTYDDGTGKFVLTSTLLASGTVTGATSQAQTFTNGITSNAKVAINGSADVSQLVVKANSTQSNSKPLIALQNSSGVALLSITSPGDGTSAFIGNNAGSSNTSGVSNMAIGLNALAANTSGSYNEAIGANTLTANVNGSYNAAVGSSAMANNTSGSWNTAFGRSALLSCSTGNNNVGIGATALLTLTSASNNVAIGYQALRLNNTGVENVAIGYNAGYSTTAHNNVALGGNALYSNTSGNRNTAIGNNSLYSSTTNWSNIAIGYDAGRYLADGVTPLTLSAGNTFIGDSTKALANSSVNEIVIGYIAVGNGTNSVTLGNSSITKTILRSNVGIGTTSPTAALDVKASTTLASSIRIRSGAAPTSPNEGDLWYDGTNLKFRDASVTRTITWT